jgi:methyl-accepting chemotaxis protein
MDEVTQQNSALVEENAATAKELERQAAAMDERVSFFHVSAADHAPSRSTVAAPAPRKAASAPVKSPAPSAKPARAVTQGALAVKDDPSWQEF